MSRAEIPGAPVEIWSYIFDFLFDPERGSFETAVIVSEVCKSFAWRLKQTKRVHLCHGENDKVTELFREPFGMKHLAKVFEAVPQQHIRAFVFSPARALTDEIKKNYAGIILPFARNLKSLSLVGTADTIVPILASPEFQSNIKNLSIGRVNGSRAAKEALAEIIARCDLAAIVVDGARTPTVDRNMLLSNKIHMEMPSPHGLCTWVYRSPVLPFEHVKVLRLSNMNGGIGEHFVVPKTVENFTLSNARNLKHLVFAGAANVKRLNLVNLGSLEEIGVLDGEEPMLRPIQKLCHMDCEQRFPARDAEMCSKMSEIADKLQRDNTVIYNSGKVFGNYSFYSYGDGERIPTYRQVHGIKFTGIYTSKRDVSKFKTERVRLVGLPKFAYLSHAACFLQSPKLEHVTLGNMTNVHLKSYIKALPKIMDAQPVPNRSFGDLKKAMCPRLRRINLVGLPGLKRNMYLFFKVYKKLSQKSQQKLYIAEHMNLS